MSDLEAGIVGKTDQQNYDQYVGGPKTVTIESVRVVDADQPWELHLVEFPGKPYKPNLTNRRLLMGIWGKQAGDWPGRQLTLWGDPSVMWGGKKVGGLKISHASHIDATKTLMLSVTRGKREQFTVHPIEVAAGPTRDDVAGWVQTAPTMDDLQTLWGQVQAAGLANDAELVALKDARKAVLSEPA